MKTYVAYYRVSTDRQSRSGLGLEAQREAVSRYQEGRGELIAEFTEVESGKKKDRPELLAALELCRRKKAVLVIAKLDRLARNVAFIANLIESGAEFVACDMPEANKTMLHIWAAMAEWERDQISKRTKEALAAAKARDVKLGNPTPLPSLEKGRITTQRRATQHQEQLYPLVSELRKRGLTYRQIAHTLEQRNERPPRGQRWHAENVRRVLKKAREFDGIKAELL